MTRVLAAGLAALLSLPGPAWAQAYKCTKPDGAVSFQDRPCQSGDQGTAIPLVAPPPIGTEVPGRKAEPRRPPEPDGTRRANEEIRAHNAQVDAQNRQVRCANARRDVGVLKEQRPVYRYDNAGNRIYVEDKNRAAELAAAQARVDAECQ